MTTILKNIGNTAGDTSYILPPVGTTEQRPSVVYTSTSFTSTGTTSWTAPTGVNAVEVLVVAGGGGGYGGGGGAGGLIYNSAYVVTPGNSYTVTVGAGGAGSGNGASNKGGNSVFDTLTAIGGGAGGNQNTTGPDTYQSGGSGGGGGRTSSVNPCNGGNGTSGQGFPGGTTHLNTSPYPGSGGGGAGGPGNRPASITLSGAGGPGLNFSISGTPTWYAGGGGSGGQDAGAGAALGGIGGGGNGANTGSNGGAGTANTGGGGGAAQNSAISGAGGSGIVIIRYAVTTDNNDPRGLIRINNEHGGLEVFENAVDGWVSQDLYKNFGGHNIHTYSETFTGTWSASFGSITNNTVTAPNGTLTGSTFAQAGASIAYLNDTISTITGKPYTFSIYVKANTVSTFIMLLYGTQFGDGATNIVCGYNLSTGVATIRDTPAGGPALSYGMTPVGNGWYRCYISARALTTGTVQEQHVRFDVSGANSFYIWGGQVEQDVTSPGPYTKTTTAPAPAPVTLKNYRIHSYTTTGTSSFTPACTGLVDVLVVAGGGSGGNRADPYSGGGGGGAGGVIYQQTYRVISGTNYTVTVGAGGAAIPRSTAAGNNGQNSQFGNLVAIGGGYGGGYGGASLVSGGFGGSGGGGGRDTVSIGGGGVTGQGYSGGTTWVGQSAGGAGGGGGAGGPGGNGQSVTSGAFVMGGGGGPGIPCDISGELKYYGGGGAGGAHGGSSGIAFGGIGGGGNGSTEGTYVAGTSGTANTGSGGGAGEGAGGSGIVIVRYRVS